MTRAERRYRTETIISKRLAIVRRWACWSFIPWNVVPGKYRKFNLSCNCGMCVEGKKFKRLRFQPEECE